MQYLCKKHELLAGLKEKAVFRHFICLFNRFSADFMSFELH